jgi:hypothetical protein
VGPFRVSVTYSGCSAAQQTALGNAISGINSTLSGEGCSMQAALKECMEGKAESITIHCGGGGCDDDELLEGEAPLNGNWVRICDGTFDDTERLEAVVFHELVHTCGKDEKTAEACQNTCYDGRGATAPTEGEDGGSCTNPTPPRPLLEDRLSSVTPAGPPLLATVATDAPSYPFGSPITVVFGLQNITNTAITVNTHWYDPNFRDPIVNPLNPCPAPLCGTLTLVDALGMFYPSQMGWELAPPTLSSFVTLANPLDVHTSTVRVTPAHFGYLPPGVYTITAYYDNVWNTYHSSTYPYAYIGTINAWVGFLESNKFSFTVTGQQVYLPLTLRNY